jgi:hypothetical protein
MEDEMPGSHDRMSKRTTTTAALTLPALALAAMALTAGCDSTAGSKNGDGGADGSTGALAAYCTMPAPGDVDYIDDMEDGNAEILGRDGRTSQWYTYNDGSEGVQKPVPNVAPDMEMIPGGRCTFSTMAMRVTGSGFSTWGSGFGFDFKTAFGPNGYAGSAYDGTAYRGITFWARVGDPSITSIWFGVGDQWSDPAGGHCDATINNGENACYDVFGASLQLTTEWKRYAFEWGQLGQRNFGLLRPALDVANLFNAHFDVPMSAPVFDVWIDDVGFFK